MGPRRNLTLGRVLGIRIDVSASWLLVLFFMIYFLGAEYFPTVLHASSTTAYLVAVAGALGYFASLILHELGHALVARRVGIPIVGINLWFFGGLSRMQREPNTPGEEFKVAAAGPAMTFALLAICLGAAALLPGSDRIESVVGASAPRTTPALALIGWLGFVNAALFVFNVVPAFPLDGGRVARAVIWRASGDRNRATYVTGRLGQLFALVLGALGLWSLGHVSPMLAFFTLMIAFLLYQSAGTAVVQGAIGRRIKDMTVADIMDRQPPTIPQETTLLDARELFFGRHHLPWFAVVDAGRHFLGVVRQQRLESEIAAGRPALSVSEVVEEDLPVLIGEQASVESLLGSEGLGRLGAMVAVDGDGVLQGVVTLAQVRQALRPAA